MKCPSFTVQVQVVVSVSVMVVASNIITTLACKRRTRLMTNLISIMFAPFIVV